VLLEKPVEANAARATAIVAACEQAGVRLAIVFQHRFRPAALELAKLVHGGKLGKLLSASASIRWWRSPEYYGGREGDPRTSGTQPGRGTLARDGGGVLLTQAIHTLDLLLHLVGPVQEVMAFVDTSPLRAIDTEDIVAASVRYANGASGVIDATTVTYPGYPERIEIAGTAGSVVLEVETLTVHYMNGERFQLAGASAGGGGADPMAFSHDHHRRVLTEFLDAIDGRREPVNSGRSALHVQRLIDALLASGKLGAPVRPV
jgi:predicted dehydrogenase